MLLRIGDFKSRTQSDMDALVSDLQMLTGRYGEEEEKAWRSSLPKVAKAFTAKAFDDLHLYFGGRGQLSLEYQLPAASFWCDMVMLGRDNKGPAAIIVELKDWMTRSDKPGRVEGLMERQGGSDLHPSDQVRGYVEYCRRFHSAVHDYSSAVHGCVLFTRDPFLKAYRAAPNDRLAADYPCFSLLPDDVNSAIPDYFARRIIAPDEQFAESFEHGEYRQDRGFISQIGKQILEPSNAPFELLDNQRYAFTVCKTTVNAALFESPDGPARTVIVIEGPPGSGKSVIAARLWASLVSEGRLPDGDVVFTTTSASQSSNWSHLFVEAAHQQAGMGVVKKATGYTPISLHKLNRLRQTHGKDLFLDSADWCQHMKLLRSLGIPFSDGARDDRYLVSIVDEAHALINPEHPDGRGQFGFAGNFGPQAYHIMRASMASIFLLDTEQGFRDRENTTISDIETWAKELGVVDIKKISLKGSQFRCAGSRDYVDWVESLLSGNGTEQNLVIANKWYLGAKNSPDMPKVAETQVVYDIPLSGKQHIQRLDFRIFETPAEMEAALRVHHGNGESVRLLASYARQWKSREIAKPHELPPHLQDFYEPYIINGQTRYWSRVWNYVPNGNNYTWFVQSLPGSPMSIDPLCEVGCSYAVRGFDFAYVGLLWFGDLKWRTDRWIVDKDQVFESGIKNTHHAARREKDLNGMANQQLLKAVVQSYRILLTRAMKGVYIWFEDEETRAHVMSSLTN